MKQSNVLFIPLFILAFTFYLISLEISKEEIYDSQIQATIVSAYFKLDESKHSSTKYETWIRNFLPQIEAPMVIFTDRKSKPLLETLRGQNPTVFITLSSLWEAEPNIRFRKAFERSFEIDPEQNIHNINLYAIWNMKPWMLREAARHNHFNSSYFVYTDIGAFRQQDHVSKLRHWPDVGHLGRIFSSNGLMDSTVLFGLIQNPWPLDDVLNQDAGMTRRPTFLQGGVLACTLNSCDVFYERFSKHVLPLRIERDWFIGSDQKCYQHYVALYPQDSIFVDTRGIESSCGDPWFYYQQWMARNKERIDKCTRTKLVRALW